MDAPGRARAAAQHRRRWSAAHGGASSASPFVRAWLEVVRVLATPLAAAGVSPGALTLTSLALALAACWPAAVGGRAVLGVPVLLAVSALGDGLDGAVAILADAASRRGAVLDAVCDRLADAAALAALWLLGAPAPFVLAAAALGWLAEYARARAQAEGLRGPGAITVSERPTRVAVAAMFALGAGCYPGAGATWATVGAVAALAAAAAGAVHLAVALHRRLG